MPGDGDTPMGGDRPLCSLPAALRGELKDPLGPIETDAEVLLRNVSGPLFAVGDVVTYHFLEAGREPDVALVDGRTKREAVDAELRRTVTAGEVREVVNPPATITAELARTLRTAIDAPDPVTILVDGEEDLAVLPTVVAAPDGASVVYGQPDEGMVHVVVDPDVRESVRELLARFDGEPETLFSILEA